MALANNATTTVESTGVSKQLFTGVVPLKVLAVNPTKKELEAIYGRDIEKEPEYLSANESGTKKVRIDFIVQNIINEDLGVLTEEINKISYYLEDRPVVGSNSGKFQAMNIYGESTWASKEEITAGKLPENLSFFPTKGMKPACVGEYDLTNFLRTYLAIPKRQRYNSNSSNDNKWENIEDISKAEVRLDDIKKYFASNVTEISSVVKTFNTNKFKMIAGVKTSDDNKQYQSFFIQEPISVNSKKFDYQVKQLKDKQSSGGYANVDFGPDDMKFRLYSNTPTNLSKPASNDPFQAAMDSGVPANAAAAIADDWFNQQ